MREPELEENTLGKLENPQKRNILFEIVFKTAMFIPFVFTLVSCIIFCETPYYIFKKLLLFLRNRKK